MGTITAKELAKKLNNRQVGNEVEPDEEELAKENGLVIVFGASDDLMEMVGAISDEYGAGETVFMKDGKVVDEDDMEVLKKYGFNLATNKIDAYYTSNGWKFETTIPHETFNVFEDEELYCTGIVFNHSDLN